MPRGSTQKEKVVTGLRCRSTLDSAIHVLVPLQAAWGKEVQGSWGGWELWLWPTSLFCPEVTEPSLSPTAVLHMHHPSAGWAILFSSLFTFQCDPVRLGKSNFWVEQGLLTPQSGGFPTMANPLTFPGLQLYNHCINSPLLYCMLPKVENGHLMIIMVSSEHMGYVNKYLWNE